MKDAVRGDSVLNKILYVTKSGEVGPDFHDIMTNRWWDITTRGKWTQHTSDYNKPFGIGTPLFTE